MKQHDFVRFERMFELAHETQGAMPVLDPASRKLPVGVGDRSIKEVLFEVACSSLGDPSSVDFDYGLLAILVLGWGDHRRAVGVPGSTPMRDPLKGQ